MITVTVRFFAGHRDIVGRAEAQYALTEGTTLGQLWEQLIAEYPQLAGYTGRLLFAVNQQFAQPSTVLANGDEVAFIPPVSGGRSDDV